MPGPYYVNTKIDDVDLIQAQDLNDIAAGFAAVEADMVGTPSTSPGSGNLAAFDGAGNLVDSGKTPPSGDILGKVGTLPQDNIAIFDASGQVVDSSKQLPSGDITGKSGAFTTGNIPEMNASGELVDSGKSAPAGDIVGKSGAFTTGNIPSIDAGGELVDSGKAVPSGDIVGTSDTQVLTGKVITDVAYDFTGSGGLALDPKLGGVQTLELTGNATPIATNFASGDSFILKVDDGAGFTIDWSGMSVIWVGGSAPVLATTNYTMIRLFKIQAIIYGQIIGDVTA